MPRPSLAILYLDADLVVVDKPAGLLVHRGWARDDDVAMMRVRDQVGAHVYPIHRLDRGASGALAFGLSPAAARSLGAAFAERRVRKRYLALVRGVPPERGVIDHPIPRVEGGERIDAVTRFRRLAVFGRYALVEAVPSTGRLHQIRRHLKHISCPLIGDVKYGKGEHNRYFRTRFGLTRLALHAAGLTVPHPRTGRYIGVRAPMPDDLGATLRALAGEAAG